MKAIMIINEEEETNQDGNRKCKFDEDATFVMTMRTIFSATFVITDAAISSVVFTTQSGFRTESEIKIRYTVFTI
ncbi:MAG: hypothetical protein IJT36_05720 [Alphaproteobacteria bacterium]|nr:hypothetical protein [Alphaproteobacteria bacterium]